MGPCPTWWPLCHIGGAICESSVIPFLVPRRKVWLMTTARLPCCSNTANIGERKTWMQSEFCTWQCARKNVYIVYQPRRRPNIMMLSDVGAVTKPTLETRWNLLGFLKLANQSQPLVGRSSPYYQDMWRRYCCLTIFPIVDTCPNFKDTARQSCAMVPRCRIFGNFLHPVFQRAACSTFRTCILNSH